MLNNRLRVGVIGVGRMGERHCRIYSTLNGVEFVGVSDRVARRGVEIADQYAVSYFPDYEDLLTRVDAVSLATTTPTHYEIAGECLRRGVHVLVEKPLAATLDDGRALVLASRHSTAILQVGHIERFNPAFLELQSVLEDLPIVALSARRLSPFDTSNVDVDVVYDLMIHDIDLALTLLGRELRLVHASGTATRTSSSDYVVAGFTNPAGALATLTASRVTEQKVRTLEVTAVGAYVEADLLRKEILIHRRTLPEYLANHQRPLRYRQESLVEHIHIPSAEPLLLELQDFIRCIRESKCPVVPADAGFRAMEIAQAIRDRLSPRPSATVALGASAWDHRA